MNAFEWFGVFLCYLALSAPLTVTLLLWDSDRLMGLGLFLQMAVPAVLLCVGFGLMKFGEWLDWG